MCICEMLVRWNWYEFIVKNSDLNLNIKILDSKETEISFLVSPYGRLKAKIRLVYPESVCGLLREICNNT